MRRSSVRWADSAAEAVLARFGLRLRRVPAGAAIPGSYWGGCEAGLIGRRLYARGDTPLHSLLHEAGHYVCLHPARRARLHTDAGSDDLEEAAVCYLQLCLAPACRVPTRRLCVDMDRWGYSFRLGSTAEWFAHDAGDARAWLIERRVLDAEGALTWRLAGGLPALSRCSGARRGPGPGAPGWPSRGRCAR